jgi:hypothetical protein
MFDPNTVYFGKLGAGYKHAAHTDCVSRAQAELVVRLANAGISGLVNLPADEAECRTLHRAVDDRLNTALKRFDELASSRTGDPRLQGQIVGQLLRWFIHGRGQPIRAKSAADEMDESA